MPEQLSYILCAESALSFSAATRHKYRREIEHFGIARER
jgi:hypothetical protein